jgi:hypothetical protein
LRRNAGVTVQWLRRNADAVETGNCVADEQADRFNNGLGGRSGRMYSHLIEAKRSAARCTPDTSGLYPRMHRKLVEAVRAGSRVSESVLASGLTDKAAVPA